MLAIIVRQSSEANLLDDVLAIPDMRGHLASFLTDKELFHLSGIRKEFSRILLADNLWRRRLIETNDTALIAIASNLRQSELFLKYARHLNFERGATSATEIMTRFTSISFSATERLPGETDSNYTERWYGGLHGMPVFFICACAVSMHALSILICNPCSILTCHPSMTDPNNPGRYIVLGLLLQTLPGGIFASAVVIHQLGIAQQVGGNLAILRPKVGRIFRKLPCSTCCQAIPKRVTTCWQAFNRGLQRCKNWLLRTHPD